VSLLPLDLAAQSGGYRTLQGGREIASEYFHWSGHTLEATVDASGYRLVTRMRYDDGWQPLAYDLTVIAIATGEQQRAVTVTVGDSLRWAVAGQPDGGVRPLPAPRAVMQNLVWSHMAAMARRLPPGRDTSLVLHTFLVDNGSVLDLTLARQGDRVTAALAGTEAVLVPAADGDLASASVPGQGLVVQRVPADSVSASRPLVVHPPAAPPAGVVEEAFSFTDGGQRLAGTLTRPDGAAGRTPVVLIIAGSGPTDRDGNSRLGYRMDVYKKLAWALARRGIASVRYDKRGVGGSTFAGDAAAVVFGDFAADAVAGARALAADARFTKVVLIGHSEGALLAERAANTGAPVAGVVMMAGMGRRFTAVLHEQMASKLDGARLAEYDSLMALFLGSGPMPAVPPDLRSLLHPSVRRFIQTENAIDPVAEARRLPVPLLVLQGATDIQVSVADAEALRAARPDAGVHILPDANHLFVHITTTEPAAQLATYNDPSLPLVPDLVPLVAAFVERVAR
jgi:hypothetical protein